MGCLSEETKKINEQEKPYQMENKQTCKDWINIPLPLIWPLPKEVDSPRLSTDTMNERMKLK